MQASTESIQSGVMDPAIVSAMPVGSTHVETTTNPPRYSRDQLLSVFSASQQQSNPNPPDVSSLFLPGWNPGHVNGSSARGWGKSTDTHAAPQEPDLCWNTAGSVKAVSLQEMSVEEKEVGHLFLPPAYYTIHYPCAHYLRDAYMIFLFFFLL